MKNAPESLVIESFVELSRLPCEQQGQAFKAQEGEERGSAQGGGEGNGPEDSDETDFDRGSEFDVRLFQWLAKPSGAAQQQPIQLTLFYSMFRRT